MRVTISKGLAKGTVKAPPSKSYAHRMLIAGALGENTTIHNVAFSNDIIATIDCLKSLGYLFDISGDQATITKGDKYSNIFSCQESGSTLRFMIPIVLALKGKGRFIGTEKLFSRGLSVYEKIFESQQIKYELGKDYLEIKGVLKPGRFEVDASISSQFITGLLFATSLLKGDSEIILVGNVESRPYIDITLDVSHQFGIKVEEKDNVFYIKGNQRYLSKEVDIEGDYSNAAFLDALNEIGGSIKIEGLIKESKQGDKVYKEYFKLLNEGHPHLDISNCIDLGPILFTLAAIKNGAIFTGINRLRIKESDRIADTLSILSLFGAEYKLENNKLEIFDRPLRGYEGVISPANDHRIVMSTAILLTMFSGTMENVEAVKKSFPNFFEILSELGIGVKYETK